jgi:uroporphyrinogen-III synthase
VARVILTQPLPRVESVASALSARGHAVVALPFARIHPRDERERLVNLSRWDWVIAVSPAAVSLLGQALGGLWPENGPYLGLIGPGSVAALESSGLSVPASRLVQPLGPPYDAGSLMCAAPFESLEERSVLVVRGEGGRDDWIDDLRSQGAQVEVLALYERVPIEPDGFARAELVASLTHGRPVYCVFTQASSVSALCSLSEARALIGSDGIGVALVIHERIADAARRAGFQSVRIIAPGQSAIAAAIE